MYSDLVWENFSLTFNFFLQILRFPRTWSDPIQLRRRRHHGTRSVPFAGFFGAERAERPVSRKVLGAEGATGRKASHLQRIFGTEDAERPVWKNFQLRGTRWRWEIFFEI